MMSSRPRPLETVDAQGPRHDKKGPPMMRMPFALFLLLFLGAPPAPAETNSRPRIGLALGGGGALGFAHIGVLKVLEEQRVPIDYIAGTSMGSIVAGLYACGMAPDEIQAFLQKLDWNEVLTDETPRRELFFRRKQDDQRYLFGMGLGPRGPKLGMGMAAGQKFNNLMQFATLRSAAITNFNELPIPYRAVATDLDSGQPFVIDHGNLGMAMRASMAVPGVFTPVELEGHLLVDGGIVDNLPVDVVKAMGADIVIAVDVGASSDTVDREKLRSLSGILARTYAIAQRPDQVKNFKLADIGIQPPLAGFTASQFSRVSEFVPRGEEGARVQAAALSRLSMTEEAYAAFLAKQRRAPLEAAHVSAVTVTGNQRVSESIIRGRIHTRPQAPLDPDLVYRDLLGVYGIDEFEQVLFTFTPDSEETGTLNYAVTEKSWGPMYFKYGLNLRSDFEEDAQWAMLLNLTRMSVNRLGGEWRTELQVGTERAVLSEFYQPMDSHGYVFVAPKFEYQTDSQDVYQDDNQIAEYALQTIEGGLDVGLQLRHHAEMRVGPIWGTGQAEVETGSADLPEMEEDYAGGRASFVVDRQDRTLFAREGYLIDVRGLVANEDMGGNVDFEKLAGSGRAHQSIGDHTLSLVLQGGTGLGNDLPGYAQFTLGGPFGFAGLAKDQFRGSYLGVASIGYRYRLMQLPAQLGRGIYGLSRFDTGNVWSEEVDTDDLRYGGMVGLGVDSATGPLFLGYGRADEGYDRIYFSLGTVF